ncbi:uncharacterized protein PG986_010691 [Apiospora aurea]|uniref:Uncharacterized protein n=1 Tax=Apiospora aurea TaxID=335848 RepID=A0ABR1Q317_9PEZI
MSQTHVESALEEQTITNALEDLSKIDKVFYDAYAHLRRTIKQSIKAYTTFRNQCDDLILQRDALIRDISAIDPVKALHLQEGTDYAVPGVLFEEGDTLLSIKTAPKRLASPEPTLRSDDASDLSATSLWRIILDRTASFIPDTEAAPNGPSRFFSIPAATTAITAITATTTTNKTTASPPDPSLTIKTDHVTKEHYWVFDLPAAAASASGRDRTALYTLRCPSSTCDNPVFSKHPLRQRRAERHFKSCGVKFRSTADLVRRYARLVVSGRKGREVKRTWARTHNMRLLAGDEAHLACENLE